MPHCKFLSAATAAFVLGIAPAFADTITVTVENFAFSPAEISAKVGDTVEWVNKDSVAHTATAQGAWDVMLDPGKSGTVTLDKAGEFDYSCRFHPSMTGKITVAAK